MTDQTTPHDGIPQPPRPSAVLAPLPTSRTVRRRTSIVVQLYRFVAINLRMAKMVRRSHQA